MTNHVTSVTAGKHTTCSICHIGFASGNALHRHLAQEHSTATDDQSSKN